MNLLEIRRIHDVLRGGTVMVPMPEFDDAHWREHGGDSFVGRDNPWLGVGRCDAHRSSSGRYHGSRTGAALPADWSHWLELLADARACADLAAEFGDIPGATLMEAIAGRAVVALAALGSGVRPGVPNYYPECNPCP